MTISLDASMSTQSSSARRETTEPSLFAPSLSRRFAATIVDGMCTGAAFIASVPLITAAVMLFHERARSFSGALTILPGFLFALIQLGLTAVRGQTLGKMAFGLYIVRRDGSPVGVVRAAVRQYSPSIIAGLIAAGAMFIDHTSALGFMLVLLTWTTDVVCIFGSEGRRLADHLAGTRVIERPRWSTIDDAT